MPTKEHKVGREEVTAIRLVRDKTDLEDGAAHLDRKRVQGHARLRPRARTDSVSCTFHDDVATQLFRRVNSMEGWAINTFAVLLIHQVSEINLAELQKTLDAQGLELVENQKENVLGRKALADRTKGGLFPCQYMVIGFDKLQNSRRYPTARSLTRSRAYSKVRVCRHRHAQGLF